MLCEFVGWMMRVELDEEIDMWQKRHAKVTEFCSTTYPAASVRLWRLHLGWVHILLVSHGEYHDIKIC